MRGWPVSVKDIPEDPDAQRNRLPIMFGALLVLYVASRLDATRPVAGVLLTYGFPIAAVAMGFLPIADSSVRTAAITVAALAAVAAELAIGRELQPSIEAFALVPPSFVSVTLIGALVGAALIQAVAAKRGLRNVFAAWVGIVTMLGLYLPAHARAGRDTLDAFIAALLVSLFVGGGAGLFLGLIVTRVVKGPARTEQPVQKSQQAEKKRDR
jgi:hypothetical protein